MRSVVTEREKDMLTYTLRIYVPYLENQKAFDEHVCNQAICTQSFIEIVPNRENLCHERQIGNSSGNSPNILFLFSFGYFHLKTLM